MVKVKICGITSLEDALAAVESGCDGLGFVFYRKSSRYISARKAKDIIASLPAGVVRIGVFVDARENTVKRIARFCKLDIIQLHGDESPEFCARFKGYKLIKAFRVKDKIDFSKVAKYQVWAYLFDTYTGFQVGGTGKRFDWELLTESSGNLKKNIFLSGGLSADNVRQAVKTVEPTWVDVSSSVEKTSGGKDRFKVKQFVRIAKGLKMEDPMKKIRKGILVLLLAGFIMFPGFSVYAAALSKNYLNVKFKYSLKYPNNYAVKTVINSNGEMVVFSSSVEDKVLGFSPNVNVVVTELGKNDTTDLAVFSDIVKKGIIKAWGNAEFLEQKKEKLNELDVYKLVSVSKQKKAVFKLMQLLLINNKKVYVFTYTALDSQYNDYLSEAKAIINSFKINK